MLCCTWRTAFPCPTRPWPKPKVGVMIPPKKQPTPAEGPKVATDAPPMFVVPGPQLPATSRVGWDGWGNFFPKAITGLQLSRESTGQLQRASPNLPKILGARPTCSNPGPPACGRVGVTSEGVTGLGLMGKEWGFHQLMLWNCRHNFCTPSLFSSAYVPLIVDRGRRKWAGVKMDSAQKASSKQRRRQGGAARRSPVPDSGVPSCWFLLCCIFWAMTWVSTEISPNHSTSPCGCCVFALALLPKAGKLMLPGCNQLSWQELERQTERATGMP